MFGLGFGEIVVVLLIALIFIGPKKLPELAKGLGKGLKEFQRATKGLSEQFEDVKNDLMKDEDEGEPTLAKQVCEAEEVPHDEFGNPLNKEVSTQDKKTS